MVFRIERNADADMFFKSWDKYLKARGALAGDVSLCRVLNVSTKDLRDKPTLGLIRRVDIASKEAEEAARAKKDTTELDQKTVQLEAELLLAQKRAAFPWITPVLGSGCLSTLDDLGGFNVTELPAELSVAALDWGSISPGGDTIFDLVFEFSANLVRSKVPYADDLTFPYTVEHTDATGEAFKDPAMCARAALAATLLNQLFHRVASLANQPVLDSHTRLVLSDNYQEYGDIREQIVDPLLLHLERFSDAVASTELEFLESHLGLIRAEVARDAVTLADAEMLTEITWHLMTRGTERYAGWNDLIFRIGIKSGTNTGTYSPDRRFPYLTNLGDQTGLREWLKSGLEATTQRSWEARLASPEHGARGRFYDAVAETLFEQSRLDKEFLPSDLEVDDDDDFDDEDETDWDPSPDLQFPPSVAYVTSFDLELEMALLNRGTPFVLIAPFEVWRGSGEAARGSLVWFYRIVPAQVPVATDTLKNLRDSGAWTFLQTDALFDTSSHIAGLPVVVRLTGCPLVDLPSIDMKTNRQLTEALKRPVKNEEKNAGTTNGVGRQADVEQRKKRHQANTEQPRALRFEISHAALLDEHTALHHWTAEVREPIRLPRELVGNRSEPTDSANTDRRFWLLLGVQIHDDSVRHRVASLVAAESLRGYVPRADLEPKFAGVVINRRSEPAQRDILQWLGLDVVEGDHTVVIDALHHYCRHLRDPVHKLRPVGNDACPLGANDLVTLEQVQ